MIITGTRLVGGKYTSGSTVTNGLTMWLDAGNPASYPGSGSAWTDLSGNGANATLFGSPTYSANNGGYLTFVPASTQYATVAGTPLNPSNYTKSVWCMFNSSTDNNLMSSNTGGHFMFTGGTNRLYCGHANWTGFPNTYPSTATISNSVWYNFTLTFNTTDGMTLYINGAQDSTYNAQLTAPAGGQVNLASFSAGGNLLNGRIAQALLYSRTLSASEILQNFNATRSRYGV